MVDTGAGHSATAWPMPKFHFNVKWNEAEMSLQEVTGLDVEVQPIEYRHGDSQQFSSIKMPGLRKNGNVTMKHGVFKSDNSSWDWINRIKMNTIERSTVTISLLDEKNAPRMVWILVNAWPTKITGTDLKSNGSEVAIETMEIAYKSVERIA